MNTEALYDLYQQYPSVQTDTRKVKAGDIFFALKGPNFDANTFAGQAIANGAAYAIIDDKTFAGDHRIIMVNDVLKSLQDLALFHRKKFSIPFIAVTGSNGKTTTRELINAVLSSTYITYTTKGNLNNHIGIPLTILNIKADAQLAVIEMGANHPGEIADYCRYSLPTHGLITNCGKAHLEGFGSEEGVRKAKGELFDYLRESGGTAFIMSEYSYLHDMSKGIPHIIEYGGSSDITGKIIRNEPFLDAEVIINGRKLEVNSQLVGAYNLPNLLAAMAVGNYFDVKDEDAANAIAAYAPSNNRSQLINASNGNKIILDAYNANPSSMKIAIENLASINTDNKILVLGAMAELGPESEQEHAEIINLIKTFSWTEVFLVGGDFLKIDHPFKKFDSAVDAGKKLKEMQFSDAYILIKGSRSQGMEKVLEALSRGIY